MVKNLLGKLATCKRCGETIRSYSVMRKWCGDCRNIKMREWSMKSRVSVGRRL